MLYYLTLIWNPESADQTAFAAQKKLALLNEKQPMWQIALDTKGMAVFYYTLGENIMYDIHRLPNEKGVIIGKLFRRSYINENSAEHMPETVVFDHALTNRVIHSSGNTLIDETWGSYIAFLRNPENNKSYVIRSPSGDPPCQYATIGEITTYFVRLEDYENINNTRLTINNHFISGHMIYRSTARRETGLEQISTLLPGERHCIIKNRTESDFPWNPIEISQKNAIKDLESAVYLSRHTLRSCIHAWSSCFDGIAVSLSGGLDSSIILACLRDSPNNPKIISRNYYMNNSPNADERKYARLAAEKSMSHLLEIEVNDNDNDETEDTTIRSLIPIGWPLPKIEISAEDDDLFKNGYDAEFYGHGGDELFARLTGLPSSVDAAWKFGIGKKSMSAILNDCAIRSLSAYFLARIAYAYGVKKKPWHMSHFIRKNNNPLISEEIFNLFKNDESHWHPLYQQTNTIPPVKYEHTFILSHGLSGSHSGISLNHPITGLSPLKSQPLLELCMQIPIELHQHRGVDRYIARASFENDIPREIYSRKSKTFGTNAVTNSLINKMEYVRETLLSGYLINNGFLNRSAVENALSKTVTPTQAETLPICDLVATELWTRNFI